MDAARRSGQQQNEANVDLNLAGSYEVLGQWDDALQAVEKSLEISHAIGDKQGEALADAELAELYGDRTSSIKDFDKAMSYYEAAKKLGLTSNVDILEVYIQTGRYGEAIAAANELLKACTNTKDTDCQGHALLSRAEAERKSAILKGAALSLQTARTLVEKSKDFYLHGRLLYSEAGQGALEGYLFAGGPQFIQQLIKVLESKKSEGGLGTERSIAEAYGFIYDELTSTLCSMSDKQGDPDENSSRLIGVAIRRNEQSQRVCRFMGPHVCIRTPPALAIRGSGNGTPITCEISFYFQQAGMGRFYLSSKAISSPICSSCVSRTCQFRESSSEVGRNSN